MASVLLVTDAGTWEQETRRHLIAEGFEVLEATHINGSFEATSVDIAVIDLGLVGSVGVAACAAIRARGATPILALARTNDELVIIGALSAGADQYAARRISTRELVARIRALLRRFPPRQAPMAGVATAGHIAIDTGRSEATVAGHVIPLVGAELEILQILLARSGRLVTRAELSLGRWGAKDGYASIDLVVRRLRDKLEAVDDRRRITTIRGLGFRLDIADPAPPAAELGVVL